MVGFQFNTGSDGGDWLITGLQVHAGEKGQAACARLIFNPLIEPCKRKIQGKGMKRCPSAQHRQQMSSQYRGLSIVVTH